MSAAQNEKRVHLTTLGCKLNQYDGEMMLTQLRAAGFRTCERPQDATLAIVNTCAVTESAERKGRAAIRTALRANPRALVIAAGCAAQRDAASLLKSGAQRVIGNLEKETLIESLNSEQRVLTDGVQHATRWSDGLNVNGLLGRTRAFLKVQDGCSQHCTYCIVPSLRGAGRSLPIEEAAQRVADLVERGFQEIVLTGVALGTYGFEWQQPRALTALLKSLEAVRGLKRVRLGSVEPWAVTPDFLRTVADSDIICRHLHLPFQSCADSVLRRMNRRYTQSHLRRILDTALALKPDWGIGADVIVGFPGETHEHYLQTRDFLADSPVAYLHVFPFSPRPGTPATKLSERVPPEVAKQRADELRLLSLDLRRRFHRRLLTSVQEVIVENRTAGKHRLGHARNYADVALPRDAAHPGQLLNVTVREADANYIYCNPVGSA